MAKSFHTILAEGTIEVLHRGQAVNLELPEWLTDAKDCLMDESALLEWAKEHEILHGLIHSGIQQEIIRIRAAARPSVNTKTDESKSIIDEQDNAQDRVNEYVCKPTLPPGSTDNKAVSKAIEAERKKMIAAMTAAGIDNDTIKSFVSKLN